MLDFEKLGVFYLGRPYDLTRREPKPGLLLYESKDLQTHAVCVGMTGSGKTGLCIAMLEEAAIDGVPAIVIDPKGDLGNLLLTFPECRGEDFRPWINEEEARQAGIPMDEYAQREADRWRNGLAEWGQGPDRIRRLRDAAEFAVYTPGSSAGTPVSILKSFAAPGANAAEDREGWRERIATTASSLLGLIGDEASPLESREHVLLSSLLDAAWKQGRDLDLATLIQQIQKPPFARVGVMDTDSFFPAKERLALALRINNLLASPGFEAWLEGEPLDIASFLHTPAGKPRIAIFSISHLGDSERMFFVTLLLNQLLGWMRAQPGTSSLRAILYMDEIFGYLPPVANPPSKTPILTLLKQARAFGLGVVLATQNPVDLDYKALANAGTWFLGRLQTERDKQRVLEGLEGAAANAGSGFDRSRMDTLLASVGRRIFLLHSVHESEPVLFETRWTLSYLRGPLTRTQIRALAPAKPAAPATRVEAAVPVPAGTASSRPNVPVEIPQYFVPSGTAAPVYHPHVAGAAQIQICDQRKGVDELREVLFLAPITNEPVPVNWENAELCDLEANELASDPEPEARFTDVPAPALKPKQYTAWSKSFTTWLFQTQKLALWRSSATGLLSRMGENERDFRVRVQQAARESRDEAVEKLRDRYAVRITALQDRLSRAEQTQEREQQQASESRLNTALTVGTGVLGALFGRKSLATQGAAAARSMARARHEAADVQRAAETAETIRLRLAELEARIEEEVAALASSAGNEIEQIEVRPKKTGIQVRFVALVWKA